MSGKLSHLTWGGLINDLVVTTNNEKSADVIVVPVRVRRTEPKEVSSPY